jgi:hypothetical protein
VPPGAILLVREVTESTAITGILGQGFLLPLITPMFFSAGVFFVEYKD